MTDKAEWLTLLCPYCHEPAVHAGAVKGEVVIITREGVTEAYHVACKDEADEADSAGEQEE